MRKVLDSKWVALAALVALSLDPGQAAAGRALDAFRRLAGPTVQTGVRMKGFNGTQVGGVAHHVALDPAKGRKMTLRPLPWANKPDPALEQKKREGLRQMKTIIRGYEAATDLSYRHGGKRDFAFVDEAGVLPPDRQALLLRFPPIHERYVGDRLYKGAPTSIIFFKRSRNWLLRETGREPVGQVSIDGLHEMGTIREMALKWVKKGEL